MLDQEILLIISNLRIAYFGVANIVKNSDREEYGHSRYGIKFDSAVHLVL